MAGYLKETCGVQQMVSNGNEGYRVQGAYDPYASTAYPFNVCYQSNPRDTVSRVVCRTLSLCLPL